MYQQTIAVAYLTDSAAHFEQVQTTLAAVQMGRFSLTRLTDWDETRAQMEAGSYDVYLVDCLKHDKAILRLLVYASDLPKPTQVIIVVPEVDLRLEQRVMAAGAAAWLELQELSPRLLRRTIHQVLFQSQTVQMLTDIHNELTDAQQSLLAERDLLRAVIDYTPDYIFAKDADHRFILSNIAHARSVQTEPDALIGKVASDFFPTDLAAQYEQDDQSIIDTGEKLINAERRTQDEHGNPRYVLTTKIPLRDDHDDCVWGLVGISRDITRRKLLEDNVRDRERHYRSIFEVMQEGILVVNTKGHITDCNEAAQIITGLSREELLGNHPRHPDWYLIQANGELFPSEEEPLRATLRTGTGQRDVIMGIHKPDRTLTWISAHSQPIIDEDGLVMGVVASFSDITALLAAQDQAREAAVNEERVKLIADFLHSASHEFRTPLSIIQTSLYLLERAEDEARRSRHFDKAQGAVERINRLVDMLLMLAKLDAITELTQQPVSIYSLLRQSVVQWARRFEQAQVRLEMDFPDDFPRVAGHASYLLYAIEELVSNALAHTAPGGTVFIAGNQDSNSTVELMIQDNGVGIAAEDLPHVFQRFWRQDPSHTTPGFGLGLPIARKIVRLHGGDIRIESKVDVGTVVRITLPTAPQEALQASYR